MRCEPSAILRRDLQKQCSSQLWANFALPSPFSSSHESCEIDQGRSSTECAHIGNLPLYRIEFTREAIEYAACTPRFAQQWAVWAMFQLEGYSVYHGAEKQLLMSIGDGAIWGGMFPRIKPISARARCLVVPIPQDILNRRCTSVDLVSTKRLSAGENVCKMGCEIGLSVFDRLSDIQLDAQQKLAQKMRNFIYLRISAPGSNLLGPSQLCGTVARAKVLIQHNLRDPDLSIDQIAATLKCTKRYLHMAFAAEATTISNYIWSTRLENCSLELLQVQPRTRSITDIAFSWGFSSSSHFTHVFKKRFGFSPSVLQKILLEGRNIRVTKLPLRSNLGPANWR